ncbi:uncharacterized protein [Penaeus vannamei]|uniref:uncharacterized protein n=1 Tax=Penaeus vannamei TaxID=6689 RepID=UPI00387F6DB5
MPFLGSPVPFLSDLLRVCVISTLWKGKGGRWGLQAYTRHHTASVYQSKVLAPHPSGGRIRDTSTEAPETGAIRIHSCIRYGASGVTLGDPEAERKVNKESWTNSKACILGTESAVKCGGGLCRSFFPVKSGVRYKAVTAYQLFSTLCMDWILGRTTVQKASLTGTKTKVQEFGDLIGEPVQSRMLRCGEDIEVTETFTYLGSVVHKLLGCGRPHKVSN